VSSLTNGDGAFLANSASQLPHPTDANSVLWIPKTAPAERHWSFMTTLRLLAELLEWEVAMAQGCRISTFPAIKFPDLAKQGQTGVEKIRCAKQNASHCIIDDELP